MEARLGLGADEVGAGCGAEVVVDDLSLDVGEEAEHVLGGDERLEAALAGRKLQHARREAEPPGARRVRALLVEHPVHKHVDVRRRPHVPGPRPPPPGTLCTRKLLQAAERQSASAVGARS